jgi:putative transcriptional regulator
MAHPDDLTAHLLVSSPALYDPNFRKTVVLMADHDENGALGLVLNHLSEVTVGQAVPPLAAAVGEEVAVSIGGPVQQDAVLILAELGDPSRLDVPILDGLGILTGVLDGDALDTARAVRVFAGYAGWGPGQLERELEEDAWLVLPALASDAFTEPDALWTDVVRRLGRDHAFLSTMPVDPGLN